MKLLLRYTVAFLLAVAFTGGMFWFLRVMIGVHVDITTLKGSARIEFTRLRRDSDVQSRREVKSKMEMPVEAPAAPMVAVAGAGGGSPAALAAAPLTGGPGRSFGFAVGGGGSLGIQKMAVQGAGSDRDAVPLVTVAQDYPPIARERGIEGWVIVQFTVTTIGSVKDLIVVDAEPKGVFEKSALKTASQWKFKAKIEGGVAVERRGMQRKLTYVMEKTQAQ